MAAALVAGVPALLDEVAVMLRPVAPEYADFVDSRGGGVVEAAEAAMSTMVEHAQLCRAAADVPDSPSPGLMTLPEPVLSLFASVGRAQWTARVALRTLISAYHVGGRVAWHHVSSTAMDSGVQPADLAALAEALFSLVEELSTASTEGYVAEQSAAAEAHARRRDELAQTLLSEHAEVAAVQAAAMGAGWRLPQHAAVVFVDPENGVGARALSKLGGDCLLLRRHGLPGAIVCDPDGPGRRTQIVDALRGAGAVIGPSGTVAQLPAGARTAELAARLLHSGALVHDPLVVDEHLDAVIVHQNPALIALLQQQCLAPLQGAAAGSRPMLRDTLRSWLRNLGDRQAVAEELNVHRQTVRYRLARLHELFGPDLDDPDHRARLMLALVWEPSTGDLP
ncbi:MAG: helix-turn-helix domain-containing protein [Mycobacteriaceae bacterium]